MEIAIKLSAIEKIIQVNTKGAFLSENPILDFYIQKNLKNGFCISLLNRSVKDLSGHVESNKQRIHFQTRLFGSLNAPRSERSWIDLFSKETQNAFSDSFRYKNPISNFLIQMHPEFNG